MPCVAKGEETVPASIDEVFAKFTDFRTWSAWMPPLFRPVWGPSRPLREGDRFLVRLGALPTLLKIERLRAPNEVCWSGGVPGFLHARHTFVFESTVEGSTRVESVEPWTGALTAITPVARAIRKTAERVGRDQLRYFRKWMVGGRN
jgi:hypothetical protein